MSNLSNFIRTCEPYQLLFSDVKELFEAKQCRVIDNETTYMIVPPADFTVFDGETPEFRAAMEHAVGTILSKSDHGVVCFGFPKTHDAHVVAPVAGRLVATEYLGGSMLNAFCHQGVWRLATNGSLDAYNNFWISSKSIGALFDEMLCRVYRMSTTFATSPLASKLNPRYTYQFVLQTPEIHFEMAERPMLFHVGTFDNTAHVYLDDERADRLPQPKIAVFNDLSGVLAYVKGMDSNSFGFTFTTQADHKTQTPRFKVLTDSFTRKQQLLGRTSNMYLRYIEAKAEGIDQELLRSFPSMRKFSSWVEKSVFDIAKKTVKIYMEKFVNKNHNIPVDFYLRPVIAAAHANYTQNRVRVSVESVTRQLFAEHPKRLNFILNGLGYLNTGDVRLPPLEAAAPAAEAEFKLPEVYVGAAQDFSSYVAPEPVDEAEPTEAEMEEIDAGIEAERQRLPMAEYIFTLDADQYSHFLRQSFMPVILQEMEIAWSEGFPVSKDLSEDVFYSLGEMDFQDITMCLEDQMMLVENVRELVRVKM